MEKKTSIFKGRKYKDKQILRTLSQVNCCCLISKTVISINYHSFLAIHNELCKSVKTAKNFYRIESNTVESLLFVGN